MQRSSSFQLHAHNLIATIYVENLAGNLCTGIAGQEDARSCKLLRVAFPLDGRALLAWLNMVVKPAMPRAASVLVGPSADTVDAMFFAPKSCAR
jgi:hypothetical protein